MSHVKVAIAGATGNLGLPIVTALLEAGHEIVVLSRKGSSSASKLPKSPQITVAEVDYESVDSLTSALKGVQVVVAALGSLATGEQQEKLIDASIAAGVSRFLPSEFGSDTLNPLSAQLPVFAGKVATQKYLVKKVESNPDFSSTLVINSAFLDWGVAVGFIIDPKNHKATLYNGGDQRFSATRLSTIGKAVVGIIAHLPETKNRAVYIHDAVVTQNQLISIVKKLEGPNSKEWDLTTVSTQTLLDEAVAELKKPSPDYHKVAYGSLPSAVYADGYGADFTPKLTNSLLGIQELSEKEVEEVIAKVISA